MEPTLTSVASQQFNDPSQLDGGVAAPGGQVDVAGGSEAWDCESVDVRVVVLLPYITKHQETQLRSATRWMPHTTLLLSTYVEPQRDYKPDHASLDTIIQRTWTIKKRWKHSSGFEDNLQMHFPVDTLSRLRKLKPDVLVSYELGARSIFAAIHRLFHRKSRLVLAVYVSEHTERSWSWLRVALRKILLRFADVVTYQGSSGKRYLSKLGVPDSKLEWLPYTAHSSMIHSGETSRDPDRRRRLLCVGQFTERKAPDAFLRILAKWCAARPNEQVEISFAGRGPLQSAIEAIPLPANLRMNMLGSVKPESIPAIYREHGILVFPTLADEWGLVVDEAMFSGLPVLSSIYAQATLDLVKDGFNGWRFKPDDESNTLDAISRMWSTSDCELDKMALQGRETVKDRTAEFGGLRFVECVRSAWKK